MRRNRKLALAAAAAAACAALSGCIPVPLVAGYQDQSRQNVPATAPESVVRGQSTRADVLLALGEPDRSADDESWLLYGSVYSKGGLLLVGAVGGPYAAALVGVGEEAMRYRLLTVRFDAAGIVSDVELQLRECSEWLVGVVTGSSGGGGRSGPCVDVSGDAQVTADRVARAAPGEDVIETFRGVAWWEGRDRPPKIPLWSPPARERGTWGDLALTDRTLLLLPAASGPPRNVRDYFTLDAAGATRSLLLASIAHAAAESAYFMLPYVRLTMADGSTAAFTIVTSGGTYDSKQTQAAAAAITDRIRAAANEPLAAPPPP